MRGDTHGGCGGRAGETHRERSRQGAPVRPNRRASTAPRCIRLLRRINAYLVPALGAAEVAKRLLGHSGKALRWCGQADRKAATHVAHSGLDARPLIRLRMRTNGVKGTTDSSSFCGRPWGWRDSPGPPGAPPGRQCCRPPHTGAPWDLLDLGRAGGCDHGVRLAMRPVRPALARERRVAHVQGRMLWVSPRRMDTSP